MPHGVVVFRRQKKLISDKYASANSNEANKRNKLRDTKLE